MLQNREFQQDIDCIKSEMSYTMYKKLFLPHPLSLLHRKLETDTILWQEEEHEEK